MSFNNIFHHKRNANTNNKHEQKIHLSIWKSCKLYLFSAIHWSFAEWFDNIEKVKVQSDIVSLLLDIYSKVDISRMRMKWPGHRASVLSQSTWVIREVQSCMCVAAVSEGCIPAGRCGGWRHSLATAASCPLIPVSAAQLSSWVLWSWRGRDLQTSPAPDASCLT